MAEFAVAVIDPGGQRWAQLLDYNQPASYLVSLLVQKLDLPSKLRYQLVPQPGDRPMKQSETLAQLGVTAGGELAIRPNRDSLLKEFLDALYDEIEDAVRDELWDLAREKLNELDRLDPNYPDLKSLRTSIAVKLAASPSATPPTPPVQQVGTSSGRATGQASGKSSSSVLGCAAIALIVGGVVIVGGAILVIGLTLLVVVLNAGSNEKLGTGDIQVTLRWDGPADIDLEVVDPFGESIWFENPISVSGGELDVDANAGCEEEARNPVENIFWPVGQAPEGPYEVYVYYFLECDGSGPTDYEVTVRVDGQVVDQIDGTLLFEDDEALVSNFSR
jgi:hypothetical protein